MRLVEACGEASRAVSRCACGVRPQREGFSEDRNDEVRDAPPTRDVERDADGITDTAKQSIKSTLNIYHY